MRLRDAATLLTNDRFHGSIYLVGYAVECYLKFAVCERRGLTYLPAELEVHDWDTLVLATGLGPEIRIQRKIASLYSALSEAWGPDLRYRTAKYERAEAARLYREMEALHEFLAEVVP